MLNNCLECKNDSDCKYGVTVDNINYQVDIESIDVQYTNDYYANPINWVSLTISDSLRYFGRIDYSVENTQYYEIMSYDDNREYPNPIVRIPQIKYNEGEIGTSYEEFVSDETVGKGYSTINAYYGGAMFHRLTGEVWEDDLYKSTRVYTGCGI